MARNKIVPGPRDREYGEGPNIDSNNIRPFKRVKKKKKKNRSTLTASAAKNNIRRFSESGHVLVREDGKWKIIDSLGPGS
tara:strand:+ start:1401 stop:1640 length:240 start_codon:yes stop_codon:yes gene_type:complete